MQKILLLGILVLFTINAEKITNLPGLARQPSFNQYSGYVTVDAKAGRSLFYWFTESQSNPSKDPVVLWLTGGPGCSSLIAFLSENGPFRPMADGKTLTMNPYSWNRVANVIWLESPAGVGFSYSNTTSDYVVGDERTANDTYTFLLSFFKQFPQFKANEFWVTGESYGGHYVPEATLRVLKGNEEGGEHINMKGFMAGNPWTYMPIDNLGAINTWWSRALVPQELAATIIKSCNLSDVGPLLYDKEFKWTPDEDPNCNEVINNVMNIFSGLDIYDIYVDVCLAQREEKHLQQYVKHGSKIHSLLLPKNPSKKRALDPCIDDHVTEYFNNPDVQKAIHAHPQAWHECSSVVQYNYTDVGKSVLPIYEEILNKYTQISVLVYSGDVDAIVPYWGTRTWVVGLKRPIKEQWRAWYGADKQVGGFVEVYDRFTFSTVRNAGHMVPWYQPERAFVLFSNFLQHGRLP